jgi:predicted transcriptional regulator
MLLRAAFPLLRVVMRRVMSINVDDAVHSRAQAIAAMRWVARMYERHRAVGRVAH